jgi:hypothetical protein
MVEIKQLYRTNLIMRQTQLVKKRMTVLLKSSWATSRVSSLKTTISGTTSVPMIRALMMGAQKVPEMLVFLMN